MQESTLLYLALAGGILGVGGLLFFDELPATKQVGTLVWTNDTTALLLTTQPVWAELTTPTFEAIGSCVQVTGYEQAGRYSNARLREAPAGMRRECP